LTEDKVSLFWDTVQSMWMFNGQIRNGGRHWNSVIIRTQHNSTFMELHSHTTTSFKYVTSVYSYLIRPAMKTAYSNRKLSLWSNSSTALIRERGASRLSCHAWGYEWTRCSQSCHPWLAPLCTFHPPSHTSNQRQQQQQQQQQQQHEFITCHCHHHHHHRRSCLCCCRTGCLEQSTWGCAVVDITAIVPASAEDRALQTLTRP